MAEAGSGTCKAAIGRPGVGRPACLPSAFYMLCKMAGSPCARCRACQHFLAESYRMPFIDLLSSLPLLLMCQSVTTAQAGGRSVPACKMKFEIGRYCVWESNNGHRRQSAPDHPPLESPQLGQPATSRKQHQCRMFPAGSMLVPAPAALQPIMQQKAAAPHAA